MVSEKDKTRRDYSDYKVDGIAGEGGLNGIHQVVAFFEDGGDVAADGAKPLRSFLTAETAGYFLRHFDHAQIPLRLVVVGGHFQNRAGSAALRRVCPAVAAANWFRCFVLSSLVYRWTGFAQGGLARS